MTTVCSWICCTAPDFLDRQDPPYSSGRLQGKTLSRLRRRLEAKTLNQPILIVKRAEVPDPEQLFLA